MAPPPPSRLVRRAPSLPLVRLGERDRVVSPSLGERFGAYRAKERDFVLELPARRAFPPSAEE